MKKLIQTSLNMMLAAGLFFVSSPSSLFAGNYGMAGCGLGAVIYGSDGGGQISAATTNSLSGNQILGITTGTLECTDDGVIKVEVKQKVYAFQNFDSLKREMARGEGERLTSLAMLMGCSADTTQQFKSMTKKEYSNLFAGEADSDAMLMRLREAGSSDATIAAGCSAL